MPNTKTHVPFIFDDKRIGRTASPAAGQETHYDALLPGFALRVSALGAKTWIVQRSVQGKPRRFTIGGYDKE